MRVLSAITDATVASRILDHLGAEVAPARDPTWEQLSWDESTSDSVA
jgi:hypothetical protein